MCVFGQRPACVRCTQAREDGLPELRQMVEQNRALQDNSELYNGALLSGRRDFAEGQIACEVPKPGRMGSESQDRWWSSIELHRTTRSCIIWPYHPGCAPNSIEKTLDWPAGPIKAASYKRGCTLLDSVWPRASCRADLADGQLACAVPKPGRMGFESWDRWWSSIELHQQGGRVSGATKRKLLFYNIFLVSFYLSK